MTFAEWLRDKPRGTLRKIELATTVHYVTLHAAKKGRAMQGRTAQLVSDYTGGDVSVAELVCPTKPSDEHEDSEPTAGAA